MAKSAKKGADLIISKARTKAASRKCNVSGEFYGALDKKDWQVGDSCSEGYCL